MSKVRVDQLTLGELAFVEKKSGQSIGSLGDGSAPKMALMMWLAYVIKRREDPKFSEADAQALTLTEITDMLDTGDAEDPTSAPQPNG